MGWRNSAIARSRRSRPASPRGRELLAEGLRHDSKEDMRKAARALREAIALRPDKPEAYYNLGAVLSDSGHIVEAAQVLLEAKERYPVGSEYWAGATAQAFSMLTQEACAEVAKPKWWDDEGRRTMWEPSRCGLTC